MNLTLENTDSAVHALLCREHCQEQCNPKERAPEIHCGLGQDGCGLSAKNVFRHTATEGSAEPFVFWPLHQHDQCQQDTDDREDRKENGNDNTQPHKGGNIEWGLPVVKSLRKEAARGPH